MRVIIPAAGKGTRLSKSPDAPPKAMYRLCGRPLLEIVLEQTDFIAPDDTYIIVGYKKEEIIGYFGNRYHYAEQREQLGTGHAVMQCADDFRGYDGTVLVTFGDMPLFRRESMKAMCEFHETKKAACTLLTAVNPELAMWARIVRDGQGRFRSIVEGKDCTPEQTKIKELFAGVLVFDSRLLFDYLPRLGTANVQHEYYLTEIPEMMAADGLTVELFPTDDPDDLRGINTPDDVVVCENILKKRIEKK
ncbi:MAG: NTP transferase domain-containing protein [Victivallales bacterium]|nr:NTP transferase domain-containing protein [Victivallales bacterium]